MKKILFLMLSIIAISACEKKPDNLAKVSHADKIRIEKCIDFICDNVYIEDTGGLCIMSNKRRISLSQKEALLLSKNWDYKNMKYYRNVSDGYLFDYEADACETAAKVKYLQEKYSTKCYMEIYLSKGYNFDSFNSDVCEDAEKAFQIMKSNHKK